MPKSFWGPEPARQTRPSTNHEEETLTTGIVTGRQEDATSSLALADEVTGGRCGQDAILADQELLHAICRTDLGNQLDNFGVPIPPIAADDKKGTFITPVSDSVLHSVTAEYLTRRLMALTFSAFRDGEQDARDERLAVVWLLENCDLLAQARANGQNGSVSIAAVCEMHNQVAMAASREASSSKCGGGAQSMTYVPGFWSVKGVKSTVLTSMFVSELWIAIGMFLGGTGYKNVEICVGKKKFTMGCSCRQGRVQGEI